MSISLADLSGATLDCLADLIEQRLENPDAVLAPATWQQAAQRDDADRELVEALHRSGRAWIASVSGASVLHTPIFSVTLH